MAQKSVRIESTLSKREFECVSWIANGKTSSEVSQILGISERTVNFHVNNSMEKLDAVNRTHLIALFVKAYLIEVIEEVGQLTTCKPCSLKKHEIVLGAQTIDFICHNICKHQSPTVRPANIA